MSIPGTIPKPVNRSRWRTRLGIAYYRIRRRLEWMRSTARFAKEQSSFELPYVISTHRTPLLRQLKDVDMGLQHNKVVNLRIAGAQLNGIVIKPGETFSYWRLIGKPTRRKGYLDGMVLHKGKVTTGVGGGLCQLSNLIYWLALHTPLQVIERYRHGYDVFPDAGRTQPFGTGATCFYNYLDLQLYNPTEAVYQLRVYLTEDELVGKWRSDQPARYRYEVFEKKHWFTQELWGGYVRHNIIFRNQYNTDGEWVGEEWIAENHALMMYEPCLPSGS